MAPVIDEALGSGRRWAAKHWYPAEVAGLQGTSLAPPSRSRFSAERKRRRQVLLAACADVTARVGAAVGDEPAEVLQDATPVGRQAFELAVRALVEWRSLAMRSCGATTSTSVGGRANRSCRSTCSGRSCSLPPDRRGRAARTDARLLEKEAGEVAINRSGACLGQRGRGQVRATTLVGASTRTATFSVHLQRPISRVSSISHDAERLRFRGARPRDEEGRWSRFSATARHPWAADARGGRPPPPAGLRHASRACPA